MKISVRQAGGVVGHLPRRENVPGHGPVSVDTADIAPERRAHLERLVERAGIVSASATRTRGYPGAERLITVDVEGNSHTARYPEGEFSDAVRELIEAVHAVVNEGGAKEARNKTAD